MACPAGKALVVTETVGKEAPTLPLPPTADTWSKFVVPGVRPPIVIEVIVLGTLATMVPPKYTLYPRALVAALLYEISKLVYYF